MSGASTLRNAVKRITHKERSQPAARKKLGLLEKHKDYVERANDYKKKQSVVKTLRKKAADRNPDEFYFRMHNSQVKGGVHRDRKDRINNSGSGDNIQAADPETIKLLKAQDMGYLAMKKAVDDSRIEKLQQTLHRIGKQTVKSHKVFVDSQQQLQQFDPAEYFDTKPEAVLERAYNRPRLHKTTSAAAGDDDGDWNLLSGKKRQRTTLSRSAKSDDSGSDLPAVTSVDDPVKKKKKNANTKAYKELQARVKRSRQLKNAMNELALQRQLSYSKGTKKKILVPATSTASGGGAVVIDEDAPRKVVYKWKRQRSR